MFWIRFTKKNEIALMDLSCITSESLPSIATRLHHLDAARLMERIRLRRISWTYTVRKPLCIILTPELIMIADS